MSQFHILSKPKLYINHTVQQAPSAPDEFIITTRINEKETETTIKLDKIENFT